MSEFHDDYPEYELMAHHSEEEGKIKRRKLWNVFWIMLAITIVELIIGFQASKLGLIDANDRTSTVSLKVIFIGLTLLKAFYIVYKFMHLGDEKKMVRYFVIVPYTIFIVYFIFIAIGEANYSKIHKEKMDELIVQQKDKLNQEAKSGGHHEGAEHHEEEGASKEEATEDAHH